MLQTVQGSIKEDVMVNKSLLLAAFAAGSLLVLPSAGHAASALPELNILSEIARDGSVVVDARRGYCRRWHRECRYRWGWGWRYRRCMRRHGC
jgi:hypothetical protein